MIQANKGAVISKFHQTSMEIWYKELKYFLGVFNRMSAISMASATTSDGPPSSEA